jgi:hypothetical protein
MSISGVGILLFSIFFRLHHQFLVEEHMPSPPPHFTLPPQTTLPPHINLSASLSFSLCPPLSLSLPPLSLVCVCVCVHARTCMHVWTLPGLLKMSCNGFQALNNDSKLYHTSDEEHDPKVHVWWPICVSDSLISSAGAARRRQPSFQRCC